MASEDKRVSVSFTQLNNLTIGAKILFATDDFFASAENLLKETSPEWREGAFDPQGKWMDGWETRRKRVAGHDFCIIKLPHPSIIHGAHLDTSFFTGNYTPRVSIQGGNLTPEEQSMLPGRTGESNKAANPSDIDRVDGLTKGWKSLVPKTTLGAGYATTCDNFMEVASREVWSHLRLNYFPDGGVARLKVYGKVKRSWSDVVANSQNVVAIEDKKAWDLLSMEHGGICVGYSNAHYGNPRNMLLRRTCSNIGDGWETARRLDRPDEITVDAKGFLESPGHEWAIFRLAFTGRLSRIQVDTTCFKGNFPDSCVVEVCSWTKSDEDLLSLARSGEDKNVWTKAVPKVKLGPHANHNFDVNPKDLGDVNYVKITIAPDGGIARLRTWGLAVEGKE